MPSTLKVQITHDQGIVVVKLTGEARLDVEDAAFQLDRVVVHHPRTIIIDASELTFLSSIGMSLLVNLRRTAAKAGGTVKLAGLQDFVRDALRHSRLLELFEVFPDLNAAMTSAAGGATGAVAPGELAAS